NEGRQFSLSPANNGTKISFGQGEVWIPFNDPASVENACHCLAFILNRNWMSEQIMQSFKDLPVIDMRLQLKAGKFNSRLINDAYSADLSSLEIALQFLSKQAGQGKKHLVLSSLHEEGNDKEKQWTALRE